MYVPKANEVTDESEVRDLVRAIGAGELVTVDGDGLPQATLLPVLWDADVVVAHMARANPHWRSVEDDAPCLVVVTGAQAYVSPSWYAAKPEHGRVVPTWNYSAVHLRGTVRVHEDPAWLREAVTSLTERHEAGRADPWSVGDAPEAFVEGQLRGIVGLEVRVTEAVGKAKLSQNRSEADRRGVLEGLAHEPGADAAEVARAMAT